MKLTEIIRPPREPQNHGHPADWNAIERILEMELPEDYKNMLNIYGTGCFFEFLYPLTPFAPFTVSTNLLSGATRQRLYAYESGQKEFPQYSPPFPVYPAESGLFPWAITVNGDTIFWLRNGSPPDWSTVICDSKFSEEYDHFALGTTDFLAQLALRKIESRVFPSDFLSFGPVFKPYSREKNLTRQP